MIESSYFIGWLTILYNKIIMLFSASYTGAICRAIGGFFSRIFSGSAIFSLIFADKDDEGLAKRSSILRLIQLIFDLPVRLMRWLDKYLSKSITGKVVYFFTDRSVYVYGCAFVLMLVVPHKYWHNTYGLALAFALLILYLFRCGHDGSRKISIIKTDIAFLCFVLSLAAAIVNPYAMSDSFRVFVTDLVPIIIAVILISDLQTQKQLDVLVFFFILGISLASLYGIYQYANHIPVDELLVDVSVSGALSRLFSTMGNPNNYAEILVMLLPLFVYAVYRCRTDLGKLCVSALSLLPLLNLYYTSSRSSWIGFAFSVFLIVLIMRPKKLPLLIFIGVVGVAFLPSGITSRLLSIGKDTSSLYRISIWKRSFEMLDENPVTGFGLGPLPYAARISRYLVSSPAHAHMQLLEIWIETGLAGLLAFLWIQLRSIRKVFAIRRDDSRRLLPACLLSGLGALMIVGLFEYVWFYPRVMWFSIILLSMLFAATNLAAGERRTLNQDS